jgi:hypothetical protein
MRHSIAHSAETAIAATRSGNAATEATRVTRDIAIRQLRAYVHISEYVVGLGPAEVITTTIRFKNTGQTPAMHGRSWISCALVAAGETPKFQPPEDAARVAEWTLPPGETKDHNVPRTHFTREEIEDIAAGRRWFYAYGRVDYVDVFGTSRWTNYRLYMSLLNGRWVWREVAKEGNDAD